MKKKKHNKPRFRFAENEFTRRHPDWDRQGVGLDYVDKGGKRFYRISAYKALGGEEQSAQVRSSVRQADVAVGNGQIDPPAHNFWCFTHNRWATVQDKYGNPKCDSDLAGILAICRTTPVFDFPNAPPALSVVEEATARLQAAVLERTNLNGGSELSGSSQGGNLPDTTKQAATEPSSQPILPVHGLAEPRSVSSDGAGIGEARDNPLVADTGSTGNTSRGGQNPIYMQVIRFVLNPTMLLARHPDYACDQHVYVGNSANFSIGMKLPVVRHPRDPGFWKLHGTTPRTKGRW